MGLSDTALRYKSQSVSQADLEDSDVAMGKTHHGGHVGRLRPDNSGLYGLFDPKTAGILVAQRLRATWRGRKVTLNFFDLGGC
jgi:hypothetical protein